MDLKLGASVWGYYYGCPKNQWPTLGDAVRSVLRVDSSLGVELWASKALDEPVPGSEEIDDLIEACSDAAFVTLHARGEYWAWNALNLRDEIDFAARINAHTLVIHPECLRLHDPEARPDYPEIVRVLAYAKQRGVLVALENIFDTMWSLDRALEEIGDDPDETNLGICLDVGHAHISSDAGRHPVVNYIERYAAQLRHLHLHDNLGANDDHLVPGLGTIEWESLIDVLERVGFHGTAVFEVQRPRTEPEQAVRQSLSYVREAIE